MSTPELTSRYTNSTLQFELGDDLFVLEFAQGILELTRKDFFSRIPGRHTWTNLSALSHIDFATDANVRWFCADAILYICFSDVPEGCYAITLRSESPQATHIPKPIFENVSRYHGVVRELALRKEEIKKDREKLSNDRVVLSSASSMHALHADCLERERKKVADSDHRNKLCTLRDSDLTDFSIACNDGKTLHAHKAVLAAFWPFFQTMMENTCKEKEENTLTLDYSSEIVELMLSDLYGGKLELTHTQAIPLMQLADMYQLPELSKIAFKKLKETKNELKLTDCIEGWRRARTGSDEEATDFFSKLIVAKSKGKKRGREEFETIDRDEALELFFGALSGGKR